MLEAGMRLRGGAGANAGFKSGHKSGCGSLFGARLGWRASKGANALERAAQEHVRMRRANAGVREMLSKFYCLRQCTSKRC